MTNEEIQAIQETARRSLPADITVTVKGERYTVTGALLSRIAFERNRAVLARQRREPRNEVMIRSDLRKLVEDTFKVGRDTAGMILASVNQAPVKNWRPEELDLAVRWDRGWKVYTVTGTRHAYYLLRKLAVRQGFQGARLNDVIVREDGWVLDNVIHLDADDILGSDRHGKGRALLDRRNSHYDLARDALKD